LKGHSRSGRSRTLMPTAGRTSGKREGVKVRGVTHHSKRRLGKGKEKRNEEKRKEDQGP